MEIVVGIWARNIYTGQIVVVHKVINGKVWATSIDTDEHLEMSRADLHPFYSRREPVN